MSLLEIKDLQLGFNDANIYKNKAFKEQFNQIFVKNKKLTELMQPQRYFLIGEKGTGKTAYAVWLSNNNHMNTYSQLKYIDETEYQKFIHMKKEKKLQLSDYTSIWKVIVYLLMAGFLKEKLSGNVITNFTKFRAINKAIDSFHNNAFKAEILTGIEFAENAQLSATVIHECAQAEGLISKTQKYSEAKFQT